MELNFSVHKLYKLYIYVYILHIFSLAKWLCHVYISSLAKQILAVMPSSQLGHCTQLPPFIRHHNTEKKRLRGEPEEGNNNFLLSRPCVCDHSLVCGAMNTHCDDRLSCLVALLLHLLRDKIFLNLSQTKQNINMANPNPKNRSVF